MENTHALWLDTRFKIHLVEPFIRRYNRDGRSYGSGPFSYPYLQINISDHNATLKARHNVGQLFAS